MKRTILIILAIVIAIGSQSCEPRRKPRRTRPKARDNRHEISVVRELSAQDSSSAKTLYLVSRVVDGDTIEITDGVGKMKLRLIGVDTPETVHPQKPVEYFGREASNFMKQLLQDEQVFLELDPINTRTEHLDRYGRLLAYVFRASDSLFVNAALIRLGYGHAYIKYEFQYSDWFEQLQREAREEGAGLWGDASQH